MESNKKINMSYIKPVYGAVCGPHNAKVLYYRNIHPSWTINIFVDHHWIYNNQELHEKKEFVLKPNPAGDYSTPNVKDVLMGCPIPGPTMQQFFWDVYDAEVVP